MSIKLMALVWEHSPYSGVKLLVHLALADHADDDGYCFPGYSFLAKKARVSRRYVIDLISEMVKEGYVIKSVQGHQVEGRRSSNLYKVVNPASLVNPSSPSLVNPSSPDLVNPSSPESSLNHHINHHSRKRVRDPRLDHPAIQAYRSEARLHVPVGWRDEVIKVVTDAELFKKIVHDWIGLGYNKQNINRILEAYKVGKVNGRGQSVAPVVLPERPDVTAAVEAWTRKYKEAHPLPPEGSPSNLFNLYWRQLTYAQAEYRKSLEGEIS